MIKFYYIYILLSLKDKKFYTGYTDNLKRRIEEHNTGKVESTKFRRPFELVYFEGCRNKSDALLREKYLKTTYGKRYIRNRIKDDLN
jgi:putative endonuclease